ncbi:hypothetical protein BDV95DRAFT_633894 [Massariosphaeria phaeospora]|uniref:Uncharacterized protein n=1 Tax=Massariosphaeria phaeospora TaxID=100035 RepID=A0A7C8IF88_9PLEO|nr:hypothetical protein BDV95DRAFT_633894 [Massariosphaeria phaeospora]
MAVADAAAGGNVQKEMLVSGPVPGWRDERWQACEAAKEGAPKSSIVRRVGTVAGQCSCKLKLGMANGQGVVEFAERAPPGPIGLAASRGVDQGSGLDPLDERLLPMAVATNNRSGLAHNKTRLAIDAVELSCSIVHIRRQLSMLAGGAGHSLATPTHKRTGPAQTS